MRDKSEIAYLWDVKNPQGYFNRMGFYKTNKEMSFIKKHLDNTINKILDLGGGSGRFSLPLLEGGFDVTLVDLNSAAIELCKNRGIAHAYCMDIREFKEINFDLVLAIELFLVTSPLEVIQIANNSLRLNGLFITVGTNKKSWRYKLHNLRKKKSKNYGDMSVLEYRNLFNKNGFEIIEIKGFNWMPFRVNSNNHLIPFIARIETFLKLDKCLNQSPWLLFCCLKKNNCCNENST